MTLGRQMQAWKSSSSKHASIVDFLRRSNLIWRKNDSGKSRLGLCSGGSCGKPGALDTLDFGVTALDFGQSLA
jgi:hypothetical protein